MPRLRQPVHSSALGRDDLQPRVSTAGVSSAVLNSGLQLGGYGIECAKPSDANPQRCARSDTRELGIRLCASGQKKNGAVGGTSAGARGRECTTDAVH
jgi:hypothetical protein